MISSIKIIAFTVLIVGVVIASISDYKTLTISNKLTFFMFSSGLILGTVHYLTNDIKNLLPYYLSILLVFIFVYILWHIGLWAGGDVKLFTAISTLLCADYLDILPRYTFYGYVFPFFGVTTFIPTLSLITNSVLSIVPIIIIVIICEIIKNKTYLIKDIVKRYDLINIASTLNAFGIIFLINDIIHIDNFMANIVFLLFISYTVNEISKKVEYTVIPLTLIILVMNVQYNNLQIYLLETAILLTVVLIKNIIKYNLLKETLSYDVKISELTESMILSYDLTRKDDKYFFDKRSIKEKLLTKDDYEHVITQKAHGLTKEDIELLKKLHEKKVLEENIRIKRSVPFVPFILCGLIITFTLGDSFLIFKRLMDVIL